MASRVTRSLFSRHHSISTVQRLLSRSSDEAKKKLYDVSTKRYFGSGFGVGEITRYKGQMHSLASINSRFAYQLSGSCKTALPTSSFYRSFASSSSAEPPGQHQDQQNKTDLSPREDPFSPTDIIPPKPVTYAEGGFYSIVILAGLGVFAFAAYATVNELLLEPKEYKIFNKALDRIQKDGQVRVRIGSPITGYGQESRNRHTRQKIPRNIWTDEEGVEHVEINFWVRGPQGKGQVACRMFKDKDDKQWKYMFLIVDIHSPTRQQLMLESFLPA